MDIEGISAPRFAGTPLIEVDFSQFGGLLFGPGSDGSTLRSLSLVNASGSGVTVNGAGSLLIVGNYIGLELDGTTALANGGNGLELDSSSGNTIGGATPLARNVISGNAGNGISLSDSSNNQILGNYVGTDATGTLDRGNAGNGILVTNSSAENADNNLIGQSEPVPGVTYFNADSVPTQPVTAWQGIRGSDVSGQYLIAGSSDPDGLLFDGTMAGVGTSYAVNYPGSTTTSVYGPNDLGGGDIQLVGSYKNADSSTAPVTVNGFVYQGRPPILPSPVTTRRSTIRRGIQLRPQHDGRPGRRQLRQPDRSWQIQPAAGPGHAYIYDIATSTVLTDIAFPGSMSNTAYGIWYNGGTSYTICGGWSPDAVNNFANQNQPIGQAYLVDYDSSTGMFSNWASFSYPNGTNLRHPFRRDQQR